MNCNNNNDNPIDIQDEFQHIEVIPDISYYAKDVEFLMEDLKVKKASNIQPGDILSGNHIITNLRTSTKKTYLITPETGRGLPFKLAENSYMILYPSNQQVLITLEHLKDEFPNIRIFKDENENIIIYVKIKDYVKLPQIIKNELYAIKGFHNGSKYGEQWVIPPSIFGYWLGFDTKYNEPLIPTDLEMVNMLEQFKDYFSRKLVDNNITFSLTDKFIDQTKEYINKNDIPECYLKMNSADTVSFIRSFISSCPNNESRLVFKSAELFNKFNIMLSGLNISTLIESYSWGYLSEQEFYVSLLVNDTFEEFGNVKQIKDFNPRKYKFTISEGYDEECIGFETQSVDNKDNNKDDNIDYTLLHDLTGVHIKKN